MIIIRYRKSKKRRPKHKKRIKVRIRGKKGSILNIGIIEEPGVFDDIEESKPHYPNFQKSSVSIKPEEIIEKLKEIYS